MEDRGRGEFWLKLVVEIVFLLFMYGIAYAACGEETAKYVLDAL